MSGGFVTWIGRGGQAVQRLLEGAALFKYGTQQLQRERAGGLHCGLMAQADRA
jgi:hypothetical protein